MEYVQPNYVLNKYLIPQDERFSEQWGLSNNGQVVSDSTGTAGIDINVVNAWDITTGSNEVTVGIIDTGVDIRHSDISRNIYVNTNEQLDGIDNDGNGYIDDLNGFDFANRDSSVFDSSDYDTHATHIAGILAAGVNNGGIAGVAPNIRILPLKFISGKTGYTSDAIEAINYGLSMGIRIFNCSWGGSQENLALKDIMANSNALFICAAGNAGQNVDVNPVYPACYQLPNVISVGAIDNRGQLATFSNYGSKVQIAAPGVAILSTLPGNNYGLMSGTSMATPFVTGVAALLKSKYPTMSALEIKARILNNATREQNLTGKVSTSGRLNASATLLNNAPSNTVQPTAEPTATPSSVPKSKGPGPIYDASASGNNKIPKPILSERNLFIDSAIKTGIVKMSSDNGIENLGLFRMKEKFVTIIWTTAVEANTELHYGNTEGVGKVYTSNKLTKKHQVEIMVDSMDDVRYFMAKSIAQDGTEFNTDIKAAADYMKDLGGNAPVFSDTVLSSNETSLSDVSAMSYIMDNGANHSFDTTQQIYQGTLFGTADESAGSDYYRIFLSAGKIYSIDLIGMAEGEDYDVYLYDSTQNTLGVSNIGGNYDEGLEYTTTAAGMYYLQVMPYTYSSTSAHHNYQLVVYSRDCPPDSYEPNDGRLVATPITAGNTTAATINVSTDEDWFVLDTAKTGKLNVTLKSIPTDCDYDLEVYESDGTTLIDGSYSSSYNDEKITKIINETGKYYIRVYNGTGSNASDTYELQANVYTPDGYELNDDAYGVKNAGAPSIDLGSCTSATIDNSDDTDFFKFTVGSDTNVGVRLQNIPEGNDYDLAVYSYDSATNNFSLISSSTNGGNSDETVISQLMAGSYYIKVYSYSGSSETQSYKLSVTNENAGIVKMDFDKTSAEVGDIITATLNVSRITSFAGYQVNIKYDPEVVQPVDDTLQPYVKGTVPTGATILTNSNYSPIACASNDLKSGILNFSVCYIDQTAYKQNGIAETSGILGLIKFKVLKSNQIQIKFDVTDSMPESNTGVYLFDWDANKIIGGFTIQQPQVVNSSLPINPQVLESSSAEDNQVLTMMGVGSYKVCGYIKPDFQVRDLKANSGFEVKIVNTNTTLTATTDESGYFEILNVPAASGYTIKISKRYFLGREITNVTVNSDTTLGKKESPVLMWGGDVKEDNAINIADIMCLVPCFCSIKGDGKYIEHYDLNTDNAINIADILAIAKHFNTVSKDYDKVIVNSLSQNVFIDIAAGWLHTVALRGDGTVWAWGYNAYGQLGDKTYINSNTPVQVKEMSGVVATSAGTYHTVALKGDGTVWAWGGNGGLLGDGTDTGSNVPVQVKGINGVIAVSAGDYHTVALKGDGTVWAWGSNYRGELGDGTDTDSNVPVQVKGISGVIAVSAGYAHTVALKGDGTVWAWGKNGGLLGDGTMTDSNVPVQVKEISGVMAISAGAYHTVALKREGTVWTWGYNWNGRLGDGTHTDSNVPVQVKEINRVIAISAGEDHTVGLKEDGTVWAWGDNYQGQLGDGTDTTDSNVPVQVNGISEAKAIEAGHYYTVTLKEDGTVWGWGNNQRGQLGNGTSSNKSPVPEKSTSSTDTSLRDITIALNGQFADFEPESIQYTIELPLETTSLPEVTAAEPYNPNASITNITDATSLPGSASIEVTAQDGTTKKTHTLHFVLSSEGAIENGGEVDNYYFKPNSTKEYNISSTGETDTYIKVYRVNNDNTETFIKSNDDSEWDTNFYISVELQKDTTYRLSVSHYDEEYGTGQYKIIVSDIVKGTLGSYKAYLEDLVAEAGGIYKRTSNNSAVVIINGVTKTFDILNSEVINEKIVVELQQFKNAFEGVLPEPDNSQTSSQSVTSLSTPTSPKGITLAEPYYKIYIAGPGDDDKENQNSNVRCIQTLLMKLECWRNPDDVWRKSTCSATGYYGRITTASVKYFQTYFMNVPATGKVDYNTALELTKYNLVYCKCSGDSGVKHLGARVREYLAYWHNIGDVNPNDSDEVHDNYTVGYSNGYITIDGNPLYYLSGLYYSSNERKCYSKVRNIDLAVECYFQGTSIPNFTDTEAPIWESDSVILIPSVTPYEVNLFWPFPDDNVGILQYIVYNNNAKIATVDGDTHFYKATGFSPYSICNFRVEAKDSAGNISSNGPSLAVFADYTIYNDFLTVEEEVHLSLEEKAAVTQQRKFQNEFLSEYVGEFSWIDVLQFGLDIAGLVPVIGEPADAINAGIYLARGNEVDAALSISSAVPIGGLLASGGKLTRKTIKAIGKFRKLERYWRT